MKRSLAFVLMLLMLLSMFPCMGLTADAASFTTKPFYLINWEAADSSIDNVFSMPQFWVKDHASPELVISWGGAETIPNLAVVLKKEFDKRPEGTRYFTYMAPQSVFRRYAESIVYFDNSVEKVRSWIDKFLERYKMRGGKLDGIVLDFEYLETSASNITDYYKKTDKQIFQKIQDHPSYQTKLRPMLVEHGFKFYSGNKSSSELYSIHSDSGSEYSVSRVAWNQVMEIWKVQYLNYAVYEPLKKHFPNAHLNDYDVMNTYNWLRTPSDLGNSSELGGNLIQAGDTGNIYTYAHRPSYWFIRDGKAPPVGYNKATMEDNVFDGFLWDMRYIKDNFAAADEGRFSAWVTCYDYHMSHYKVGNGYRLKNIVSGTAYHTETIYHVAMTDPDPMMGYILKQEIKQDIINAGGATPTDAQLTVEYNKRIANFSAILDELTRVVGFSDRKPIEYPGSWNSDFVISGMYAGGRNVWRITPDTTKGMTLARFKVEDKTPTFYINGQTVIFPQGKIIEETRIEPYGSCGYWVETPAGVEPVVVNDVDRHSKYPAYEETFSATLNKKYWQTTGTVTVKSNVSAVDLANGATLKNVTVPKRITAGDNYANQQGWELAFMTPKTVSAVDATLLSCGSGDGFRLMNGKLYYSDSGNYRELVNVSDGKLYTVKREMDFAAKKCGYYVYDASGTELAKATGTLNVSGPVSTISFSAKTAGSEVLRLDYYKLYPMGVTADFYLYDAQSGYKLTGAANAGATAYRLSWMNASPQAKKATVVAEFYNGNTLVSQKTVREMILAPGADGVETEIVPLSAGKSVKLRVVVTDSVPAPDGGGEQGGNTDGSQDDTSDKSVDDTTHESINNTTDETVDNTTDESVDDTTNDTTDDTTEDTADNTTDNTVDTPDTPELGEKKGLGVGWIVLIVVGSLVAAAAITLGVLFLVKKENTIPWIIATAKRIFKK